MPYSRRRRVFANLTEPAKLGFSALTCMKMKPRSLRVVVVFVGHERHAFVVARRDEMNFTFYDQNGVSDLLEPYMNQLRNLGVYVHYGQDVNLCGVRGAPEGNSCLRYANELLRRGYERLPVGGLDTWFEQ